MSKINKNSLPYLRGRLRDLNLNTTEIISERREVHFKILNKDMSDRERKKRLKYIICDYLNQEL